MAVELASGFVSLSVKLDGATKGLGKLFDSAQKSAASAGKKTGEAYTKALESELKTAEAQTKKFSDSRQKALDKEADAAGKTKVALEKLNEARTGGLTGSKLTQLEEQHESAMRKQAAAAKELARETDGLTQAQKRQARAQDALDTNQNNKPGRFRSLFSGVGDGAEREGSNAAGRFSSGFSKAMKAAGALAIGGSIVGSLSKVVTTGLDFEKTMNTLSGVTGSSADVMQRFRDTAKALGNDVSLSNTSASDAAVAMTELAKAGFSVDEAMKGARGTLQLAAAAQIDAGSAATIQANALQAFGLKADYAGKAADILANAANASSAEIVDVAQALQQGGAVASSFGLSIEDTSAAIALLANNGIKGSDAGTLLKSALLALTDTSNPAQGAIQELGLTVYDAQGNFVGLEKLMGELKSASQRLTPEMYQAATSTLFGSDAARLAAVSAKEGAGGFDKMRDAINKQGSAAELAAAQNQGLPGVIARIKNAASTLAITLFEKIQGPLQNIGNGVTDFIGKMQTAFENPAVGQAASNIGSALSGIGTAFGAVASTVGPALVGGLSEAVNLFTRFKDVIVPLAAAFVAYKVAVFATTLPLKAAAAAQVALNVAMSLNPIGLVVAAIAGLIAGIVLLYKKNETFRNIVQTTWSAIKVAIGAVWGWITDTVVPALKAAWDVIAAAALALWQGAIQPAWNGIKQVISFAWEIISDIFNNWKIAMGLVGSVATALWQTYIAPAWEGIKAAFSAAWDYISPIFENVKGAFSSTGNFIKTVWNGVAGVIKSAFDGIVNAVKPGLHMLGSMLAAIPSNLGPFDIPGADTARAWGQKLQAFRGGGLVRGPGTGTSDSVLAWLSNGEGVLTKKAMSNGGAPIMTALNAGWVPPAGFLHTMLPGFASGGPVGNLYRVASGLVGTHYVRGGHSTAGVDCSGAASVLVNALLGLDPYGDRMATGNAADWLAGKGAIMGKGPEGTLRIGWKNGGPGGGHMAVTLPDGRHAESGGSVGDFTIGGGAAGADDPQFTNQAFIPFDAVFPDGAPSGFTSPLSGGTGGYGGGGGGSSLSGGGGATPKQRREADDRVTDLQNRLDIAEQELDAVNADPKAKDSSKQRKADQVDKLKRDLQQAKDDRDSLAATGTGGTSGSGGNDPFSKILDGFGELGQMGIDGAVESLLPPGFDNPMEWGITKMAGGLLSFAGGLMPDPISQGIFGALGSGIQGNAGGAASALAGIFSPQQQGSNIIGNDPAAMPGVGYGDMGGAYSAGAAGPNPTAPVDNSINTTFSGPVNYDAVQAKQQSSNNMQLRRPFGTARMVT